MKWGLAGLTGILYFLAIAPRDQFWLGWLVFLPLLWAHRDVSAKKAFMLGWLAGTVSNLGIFYWVYEVVVNHSAMPAVGGVVVTLFLAVQQGIREALWLGLCKRFSNGKWPTLLTYPTVYVACEFLYPTIFPSHLSNTQHNCLLSHQLMDIAGPAGLSWVIMAFTVGLFQLLMLKRYNHQSAIALGLLLATLAYGQVRVTQIERQMADAEKLRVGMVENNVGLGLVDLATALRQISMAAELAAKEKPDLIVFPETAVKTPPPPHRLKGDPNVHLAASRFYPLSIEQLSQEDQYSPQLGYRVPILFGCTATDLNRPGPVPGRPALFNAAFLVDAQGKVLGHALKNKLLLFGEYVPGASYFPWIYSEVLTQASALYPGTEPAVLELDGHRVGVSICYEDILPVFSRQILLEKPELLINLTNDGWFGKTDEPYTHLALAKARAVEARLYMVRSTCTGVSAFIDPLGRVIGESDLEGPETLVADVAWMPGGTVFAAVGVHFPWLCLLLSLVWFGLNRGAKVESPSNAQEDSGQ